MIYLALTIYAWLIVARTVLSWLQPRPGSAVFRAYRVLFDVTEPYLALLLVLFIAIQILVRLQRFGQRLAASELPPASGARRKRVDLSATRSRPVGTASGAGREPVHRRELLLGQRPGRCRGHVGADLRG